MTTTGYTMIVIASTGRIKSDFLDLIGQYLVKVAHNLQYVGFVVDVNSIRLKCILIHLIHV